MAGCNKSACNRRGCNRVFVHAFSRSRRRYVFTAFHIHMYISWNKRNSIVEYSPAICSAAHPLGTRKLLFFASSSSFSEVRLSSKRRTAAGGRGGETGPRRTTSRKPSAPSRGIPFTSSASREESRHGDAAHLLHSGERFAFSTSLTLRRAYGEQHDAGSEITKIECSPPHADRGVTGSRGEARGITSFSVRPDVREERDGGTRRRGRKRERESAHTSCLRIIGRATTQTRKKGSMILDTLDGSDYAVSRVVSMSDGKRVREKDDARVRSVKSLLIKTNALFEQQHSTEALKRGADCSRT